MCSTRGAKIPTLQHTSHDLIVTINGIVIIQISSESGDSDTDGPVDAQGKVLPVCPRSERQWIHVQKSPRTLTSS